MQPGPKMEEENSKYNNVVGFNYQANMRQQSTHRALAACVSGMVAGLLGAEGLIGFAVIIQ